MSEEFKKDEKGRYICPNCGKSMDSISQTQYDIVRWKWNKIDKKYVKQDSGGDAESCTCNNCGTNIGYEIGEKLGY